MSDEFELIILRKLDELLFILENKQKSSKDHHENINRKLDLILEKLEK